METLETDCIGLRYWWAYYYRDSVEKACLSFKKAYLYLGDENFSEYI